MAVKPMTGQAFPPSPRRAPVLASVLATGLMLTAASCSHLTPLGPTPPQPHHLRSPIVLQAMRVQNPTPAGGCPAGFTKLSAPGQGPGCYRPLGAPVTITSAAVAPGPTVGPASPSDAPPSGYGLLIALPAAERTVAPGTLARRGELGETGRAPAGWRGVLDAHGLQDDR